MQFYYTFKTNYALRHLGKNSKFLFQLLIKIHEIYGVTLTSETEKKLTNVGQFTSLSINVYYKS